MDRDRDIAWEEALMIARSVMRNEARSVVREEKKGVPCHGKKGKKKQSKKRRKKGGQQGDHLSTSSIPRSLYLACPSLPVEEKQDTKPGESVVDVPKSQDEEEPDEDEDLCAICLIEMEGLNTWDGVGALICDHFFHLECLDLWTGTCKAKKIEPTCPTCRELIVRK